MISEFVEITEGKTRLVVPALSVGAKVPPKYPAFFNPSAQLNRDISILVYKNFAPHMRSDNRTFADSLTSVGSRALRVSVEVPAINDVYANDINPIAIEMAKSSARLNGVDNKISFSQEEVCKFLVNHLSKDGERFGIVDLDPFGTPAPYIDCLLRSVIDGGLVSLTATDTAVLCGIYPKVCMRRYYGAPINNDYANEIALRLMLSLLSLTASRLELGITPVFVHSNIHYLRVYAVVSVSSTDANNVYDNIGYIQHCFKCGNRSIVHDRTIKTHSICDLCKSAYRIAGQLWKGRLFDKNYLKEIISSINNSDNDKLKDNRIGNMDKIRKLVMTCYDELDDIPYYFRSDEIASKLKASPMPIDKIIEKLHSSGYAASRASLHSGGFKTNARIDQILEIAGN